MPLVLPSTAAPELGEPLKVLLCVAGLATATSVLPPGEVLPLFVIGKTAGVKLDTVALMTYVPATLFAVRAGAVAMPLTALKAVASTAPPAKVAPAPLEAAVKSTGIPATALPLPSVTFTCNAVPNAAPGVTV